MKKTLLLLLLSSISFAGFSTIHTIGNSAFTFTPATLQIQKADTVIFKLGSIHNAREVSQATYEVNGATGNGGFEVPLGGDTVFGRDLAVGTHYYVCVPHAEGGMKGIIVVNGPTGIFSSKASVSNANAFPNPFLNKVTVEAAGADMISVTNAAGVKLFSQTFRAGQSAIEIDGEALPSGVYYVAILKNGVIVETKKIVKN